MVSLNSPGRSERLILSYGVAVVSVIASAIGLMLMKAYWQVSAPVSLFLMAVIISTWVGGVRPGLLALALSTLAFAYLQQPVHWARLLSLGIVASYVVWITVSQRGAGGSLRRARDELRRSNDALRVENAESRRAQEALRVSEAKFRAWSQSAPSAIFILQAEKIGYANPAAAVITGYSCEELVGMSFADIIHPDFRARIATALQAPRPGEPVVFREELKIITNTGAERWVESVKRRFELEGKPAVVCIVSDITERKRAEQAASESQQLLQLVLATLPVGVAVTDRAGDIILANTTMNHIWGERPIVRGAERWAEAVGVWHESGKRIAATEWASVRALTEGQTSLNELIDIETYDRQPKTIQNSSAPIRNAEGQIVGAVIVNEDVTERVRGQTALHEFASRLQHLSRRLLKVQEEERRHLSRELHDEFGQLLASITLHLHAAKGVAGASAQSSLDESIALLQRAGAQVRSLALELRPTMLETGGLESALRWLAQQHQQRTGIVTEVVGHVTDVPGDVAIGCFRVAQEALTNVVRHARAQHVWIELHQHEGSLELVVRDDGVGFDVTKTIERAASGGNLGLLGMRERVEILGGSLEIDSQSGHGTRIRIALPLSEPISMLAQHRA
ncbi:MAG TPA: PAS domain S-box protein [Steroidobacteraceae bacterium]|jgi:PAS domain S-box-containing protein|nr:PAS domain S-box protein [Steroidobacteraceae bacterium]